MQTKEPEPDSVEEERRQVLWTRVLPRGGSPGSLKEESLKQVQSAFRAMEPEPAGNRALISMKRVCKSYETPAGWFEALRNIDLEVREGEFVAVVGKSGSGKSTLINVLTGIDNPSAGEIHVASTAVHALGQEQLTTAVRIVMREHDAKAIIAVTRDIERALERENIGIKVGWSEARLGTAQSGHVSLLIAALILMAVIMAVVGVIGLMSAMGTSVVERSREFGVMRAIGGQSSAIIRNVMSEGVFIGAMSWVIAGLLSLPLSAAVGRLVGTLAFFSPLPLTLSPAAVVGWLAIVVVGSMAASAYPAWKASRLTIRETLAYT